MATECSCPTCFHRNLIILNNIINKMLGFSHTYKFNYLKNEIINTYKNPENIKLCDVISKNIKNITYDEKEICMSYLLQLCSIICADFLYEIYISELYYIIPKIRKYRFYIYSVNKSFLNINNEMEKIKKNMFIKYCFLY
jgi:hypothetical protein